MELKEGMYVRTERYGISKLYREFYEDEVDVGIGIMSEIDGFFIDKEEIYWIGKDEVLKASYNLIDLIEVGDYVNGLKITLIYEPSMANCYKRIVYAEDEEGYLIKSFDENDIKSIVTKEQFESMSYKIGE